MNDKINMGKLVDHIETVQGFVNDTTSLVLKELINLINSGEFDCNYNDIPKSIIDKLDRAEQCVINADKDEVISLFSSIIKDLLNHIDKNCQTKDKQ